MEGRFLRKSPRKIDGRRAEPDREAAKWRNHRAVADQEHRRFIRIVGSG